MSALDFGKGKGLVGQHGEKTVSVLCSRKLHERRGKLYHEMGLVGAVRRVVPLHFPYNAPRFRFNQPVPQCGDMRLNVESDCVLLPAGIRSRKVQWEVPRKSNGWAYGFGRANVWYASEEDSRLQDYLTRLVKQIDEYDGENWIDKYAE